MHKSGFGLIEVVVGMAIMASVFVALVGVARFSLNIMDISNVRLRAAFLLSEGIEAVKINRDQSWANRISTLTNGTAYYLSYSSGAWSFTTFTPAKIDGLFDRTVTFAEVRRDGLDNIVSSGGSVDLKTRLVTITATWSYLGRNYSESISTYITDLFNN